MSRLIAFGCSHTYGMGLEDSFVKEELFKPHTNPSKHAWPNLLAKKLGYECINLSIPGGSNLEILYSIMEFKFHADDKVVVGWTSPLRDIILYPEKNIRIAPFLINKQFAKKQLEALVSNLYPEIEAAELRKINKKYYEVHSEDDMHTRSWLHQYTAGCYLKSKDINFLFASAWGWKSPQITVESFIKLDNFLDDLYNRQLLDYANDNMHMGPKAHNIFADDVLRYF